MVTVRASAFRLTTLSMAFIERNWSWLSAMWLKQWRVPSTFSLLCLRTNSCTSSTEPAENIRSVPYSTLPAQLWSFSEEAQAVSLDRNGLAIAAEQILRKVRLFMVALKNPARCPALESRTRLILYPFRRTFPGRPRLFASGSFWPRAEQPKEFLCKRKRWG